jgi:hypothetical protein
MKAFHKGLSLALLAVASLLWLAPVPAADSGTDPAVGSWSLNTAKSKPDPSLPAVKSQVRTYTASPGGLTVAVHSVLPDGSTHDVGSSFAYDGKKHAVTGVDAYDSIRVKRLGPGSSYSSLYLGGKSIGHLTRRVSKDGKTMTVTSIYTDKSGNKVHDVGVYDRQ